jgi:glyoxylase-like metal-dependent hydrolase (beta-lactamase superfamily II)
MPNYICTTCGTQYPETDDAPTSCPICEDERQYVGPNGQEWTTLERLRETHTNRVEPKERGLFGIGTEPHFGIGQRALLVQTPRGNVLWDCIALLDDATARWIEALGGLSAIAISHPHYYTTMVEWARAFDVPVYLHEDDREWVMRPEPHLDFWSGETREIGDGLTLLRLGGHFPGGQVLHWRDGAEGRGALLTGDIIQVVSDTRWVSFMYSYPNLIPLPADTVLRIADAVQPFAFDRIYGAWWGRNVLENAKDAVRRSAERYVAALEPAARAHA